jgi:hypothetical protein
MKKTYKLLLSMIILVSTNLYSQLSINISQVKLNSVNTNTPVNIGTSETATVQYLVTVTKDNNTTFGNCLLTVGRYKNNSFVTQVITPEMLYYGPNNVGSQGTYSFVIADYNLGFGCNEDYFQAKIEQTSSPSSAKSS